MADIQKFNFIKFACLIIFSIYFFLWSQKIFIFDERYLLFILIPLSFFFFKEKKNKLENVKFLIIVNIFILLHLTYNLFTYELDIIGIIKALMGFILLSYVVYFFKDFLIFNIGKIIGIFLFILLVFFLVENLFFKNYYSLNNFDCLNGWFYKYNINLRLFTENSHFGMMAPAIISYFTFRKNEKFQEKIFSVIIISFLFLFLSTTFIMGTLIIMSLILFTSFSNTNYFNKIISCILIIICLLLIFFKPQCNMRITETINGTITYLKISFTKTKIYANKQLSHKEIADLKKQKIEKIRKDWISTLDHNTVNLSSEVILNSYHISFNSLVNNPLGNGLNNYDIAFNKYREQLSDDSFLLNSEDAGNNFSKMITEFGIFSFLIFSIIVYFSFKNFVGLPQKAFFLSIILTQLMRGAGYYNGAFMLSLLIIMTIVSSNKKPQD